MTHGTSHDMKDRVDDMKDRVNDMKDEVDGMKDGVDGMKHGVDGMKDEVDGMKDEVDGMKDGVDDNLYKMISLPSVDGLRHRLVLHTPFTAHSIISYGLIVFARDTRRWALVQRKHSVEFLIFMRGVYRLTYLSFLISCVTVGEADIIRNCIVNGPDDFKRIYLDLGLCPDGLEYSLIRMAESIMIVRSLLDTIDLSKNTLVWNWPKGRLSLSHKKEQPFDCAKREFAEETEITLPSPLFISDSYVSEKIKTLMGRNIESRYWIYVIPEEIPMLPPEHNQEVSNRTWMDTETSLTMLKHTDLFVKIYNLILAMEL